MKVFVDVNSPAFQGDSVPLQEFSAFEIPFTPDAGLRNDFGLITGQTKHNFGWSENPSLGLQHIWFDPQTIIVEEWVLFPV